MLEIGNMLWDHYLMIKEGGKKQAEAMKQCPATLPFTRDFNTCVGALSLFPHGADATETAKLLLKRFYAEKLSEPQYKALVTTRIDGFPCSELKN